MHKQCIACTSNASHSAGTSESGRAFRSHVIILARFDDGQGKARSMMPFGACKATVLCVCEHAKKQLLIDGSALPLLHLNVVPYAKMYCGQDLDNDNGYTYQQKLGVCLAIFLAKQACSEHHDDNS